MKRIFLIAVLLTSSLLSAATQYSKAQCDGLKAQKEQIRKRMNQGYGVAEGNWLNKRDRELFMLIGQHCSSPFENEAKVSNSGAHPTAPRPNSMHSSTIQKNMPDWSATNHIFKGDQAAAWSQYYQVPNQCRQKNLSEADFVKCANHKSEQRKQFDQMWQSLNFTPLTAGVSGSATPPIQQQPHYETMPVYTTAPSNPPNEAKQNTVTVDKDFHQHFTWFGIAFVVFIGVSSWLIWRK
ncbi:hypothetical protein [Rheinheimera aquimaris]|uniref:hypothetical protein n=1 Tax=Rheinheimera aquimaris TaxID=412437 RepID=UPI003A97A02A